MNDGMYTNIRNYLEEIAGQQKQILAEQKRTNELLDKQGKPTTPHILPAERIYNPAEGPIPYDPATSASMPEKVTRSADIHFDDGTKITHQKTADAFVTGTEQRAAPDKPKTAGSPLGKKPAKKNDPKPDVKPQVNWNSRSE